MIEDFDAAANWVHVQECGPGAPKGKCPLTSDHAGRTLHGISEKYHPDIWKRGTPTVDDFKAVFRSAYWDSLRCDNLPWPVNLALADFAYHSGNQKATRVLQHALIEAKQQVEADGRMGEETIAAVKNVDAKELALNLCAWRIEFLQDLCEQKPAMGVFQAGWLKRVKRLMEKIG